MVERDFYRLSPFTKADAEFFDSWLQSRVSPHWRKTHQSLYISFARIANANEILQKRSGISDAEKLNAQNLVIETEEKLHGEIEKRALPVIRALRQKNLEFLNDYKATMDFFHFIAHQYFRTKSVREKIGKVLATITPDYDFSRLRNLFCHCFADTFGGSLFVDRKIFDIVFLENQNGEFITGDQPVVNLVRKESMEHDDIALYYPLGPRLAVLIAFKGFRCGSMAVPYETIEELNKSIAFESNHFRVAVSEEALQPFVGDSPRGQPDALMLLTN